MTFSPWIPASFRDRPECPQPLPQAHCVPIPEVYPLMLLEKRSQPNVSGSKKKLTDSRGEVGLSNAPCGGEALPERPIRLIRSSQPFTEI